MPGSDQGLQPFTAPPGPDVNARNSRRPTDHEGSLWKMEHGGYVNASGVGESSKADGHPILPVGAEWDALRMLMATGDTHRCKMELAA